MPEGTLARASPSANDKLRLLFFIGALKDGGAGGSNALTCHTKSQDSTTRYVAAMFKTGLANAPSSFPRDFRS
jgi:hypothetical protein